MALGGTDPVRYRRDAFITIYNCLLQPLTKLCSPLVLSQFQQVYSIVLCWRCCCGGCRSVGSERSGKFSRILFVEPYLKYSPTAFRFPFQIGLH